MFAEEWIDDFAMIDMAAQEQWDDGENEPKLLFKYKRVETVEDVE